MKPGMKMFIAARKNDGGEQNRRGEQMERGGNTRSEGGRSEMRGGENRYEGMRYEGGRSEMREGSGEDMRRGGARYESGSPGMRYEGMNDGEMRRGGGGRGRMEYDGMENEDMEGPSEEMRRRYRRYRDGRFAPKNRYFPPEYGGEEMEMESRNREMNNYPQQRRMEERMNHIGFDGGFMEEGMIAFPEKERKASQRLDKKTAEEWVESMKNEDGTKGPHWTMEQTEQVRRQKGLDCDPLEFWVAMNASYSDLSKLAKKYSVNNMDYYVDYVLSYWFKDKDAVPNKLAAYYESVVKK